MATDLNVAQLLEISKVEGLDGKAVLQSINAAASASGGDRSNGIAHPHDNKESNADASYVFVHDPSLPLPDQPQSQQHQQHFVVDHVQKPSSDVDLTSVADPVEPDQKTSLSLTHQEPKHALDDSQSQSQKNLNTIGQNDDNLDDASQSVIQGATATNHPDSQDGEVEAQTKPQLQSDLHQPTHGDNNVESDANQLECEEQKAAEEEKLAQVLLTETNSDQPGPREEKVEADNKLQQTAEASQSGLQQPTHGDVKVNQDEPVLDVLAEENTKPVIEDMDFNTIDSSQPHPEEKTEDEKKLPLVVDAIDSDLHTFTHGEEKVHQDKPVSDVIEEKTKEPVNEGRGITEADSNQLDPEEQKLQEENKLPRVVQVVDSDSHRLTHGEEDADQVRSVSDAIVEETKEPIYETTDISEVDLKHLNLEKVKEDEKLPEVAAAVKSDLHPLAHVEEKADEDKSVSDVTVEEHKELGMEMTDNSKVDSNHPTLEGNAKEERKLPEVTEAVESVLHQFAHGKVKVNQDESDPGVVEEHKEPVIECTNIVESESNRSSPEEEKVEDKKQVPEIVEVAESDLHQLAHAEQKVDDQANSDNESESIGSQALISQTVVTDSLDKSELLQPYDGGNKVGEISEVGAHVEALENQSSQLPVVEACESEPLHVCVEEETGEQKELHSSLDLSQDTQIESASNCSEDVKEYSRGTLLDKIPMSEPSKHLETENVTSETVTCPSADLQLEMEAKSKTDEVIGDLTTSAVEQTVLESGILNTSNEDQKKSSTFSIGQNESEPQSVNEQVQNTETSVFEMKSERDVEDMTAESGEGISSSYDGNVTLETEAVEDFVDRNECMSSVEDLKSDAEVGNGPVDCNQGTEAITSHSDCFTGSTNISANPVDDAESKSGEGISSPRSLMLPATDTAKLESPISCGPVISGENNSDPINNVKSIEIEEVHADRNGQSVHEGNGTETIGVSGSSSPSAECSTIGSLGAENVDSAVGKKPFRFLIRIPRYNDDKTRNQIDLAQKKVEQKTRDRDAIRSTIQSRRAICGEYRDTFEAARSEERAARDALNVKRREMDSVQSVISRKKNANSVEDIDDRIRIMEHRIEHETVPLKEEKQLIREIKQMKNLREQLSSTLGQQAEVEPTFEERVKLEERHKPLKQEIEQCRREVSRLEGITRDAWKIYFDENEKLKEMQAQFRTADDLRQEAYIELQNLKKQLYEKNKYFRMYKEDAWKAEDYSSKGDKEALHNLCINQVETIMELWNKNDEFRNEYIRCNTMSTLRRLKTLDGRSLGPDEEPPLLRNGLEERVDNSLVGSANKLEFPSLLPSQGKQVTKDITSAENLEQKNQKVDAKSVLHLEQKNLKSDSKSVLNLEQIHPIAKSNKVTKSAGLENISETVSGSNEKEDDVEESKRAMEEDILARKAEELWKEKEAAKLKEQRRLEEKAKAKEAEERKRRNAEKAQARAELRAQKEAQLREKEREKKARKKERKMAEGTTGGNATESLSRPESTQPETTQEPEIKEKSKTAGKRPQKHSLLAKQIKPKVVPPPLRNRNKKTMQQWMWILLLVVVVTALFLLGNIGFSLKFGLNGLNF